MININSVGIKKVVLSTKTPYGNKGANKYYVGYLDGSFKQLNVVINDTEMCANNMHILPSSPNFLKYIEIWDKIVSLFNKNTSKNFRYDIEYIKPKTSFFNENRYDINKRLKRGNYYGAFILSIDFICETTSKL